MICQILLAALLCTHPVVTLGLAQGAAEAWDGYTTRRNIESGHYEADPISRAFIGRYPTWDTMIPAGTLQVVGTALLAERMRRSRNRFVRKLWFLPQAASIGVSLAMVRHNERLR